MKSVLALSAIVLAASLSAQALGQGTPPISERLCGKLQYVEWTPVGGNTTLKSEHNLPHTTLSLYPDDGNGNCCDRVAAVAIATSGRWGSFAFKLKHLPGGLYWLRTEARGRTYRILIRYAPKKHSDELCTQAYWQVDNRGDFGMGHTITVD